jgi:hypothetical protein
LNIDAVYKGPSIIKDFHLLSLHQWNFLFIIGALFALIALQLLVRVKEKGEVEKDVVVRILRSTIKNNVKDNFIIGRLLDAHEHVKSRIGEMFYRKSGDSNKPDES